MTIVLASSSPYRKQLLARLNIDADCIAPNIDESANADEQPHDLALRLALAKAQAVSNQYPDKIVLGSDQVASLGNRTLGKPGTHEKAIEQLKLQSGQSVFFYTALCVQQGATVKTDVNQTEVIFRTLSQNEIERYIALEQPLDCAGSFKCEGLGICLFEKVISNDPSALIGLPLIKTAQFLREFGLNPLY